MKNMFKIGIFIVICTVASCGKLSKDEEMTISRTDYYGKELRTDGYYYRQDKEPQGTIVLFLFRNGIILSGHFFPTYDLYEVECKLVTYYDRFQNDKSGWGVFLIENKALKYEIWSTSTGGGLPVGKAFGYIENDSTFSINKHANSGDEMEFTRNDIYHFRKFYPKPDSTNKWIK